MKPITFYAIRFFISLYNAITFPVFLLLDRPQKFRRQIKSPRSLKVSDNKWISAATSRSDPMHGFLTAAHLFEAIGSLYDGKRCLGFRNVLEINHVDQSPGQSGKPGSIVKKRLADEYTWMSYREVDLVVQEMIRGYSCHGIRAGDKVLLALETRPEWLMTAMSVIRMGSTLSTVYSTCGIDGLVHAVNEIACSHVITNQRICDSIISVANQLPNLRKVIVVQDQLVPAKTQITKTDLEIISLAQVRKDGQVMDVKLTNGYKTTESNGSLPTNGYGNAHSMNNNNGNVIKNGTKHCSNSHTSSISPVTCKPSDLALIMYTSGTTGLPKGVMFTQQSLIEALRVVHSMYNADQGYRFEFAHDMNDLTSTCFFAYLPTAHIFELCQEFFIISLGGRIGYGSPFTAFQTSTGLMAGTRGDAEVLNPTYTIAVPLVCERIKSSICDQVSRKSPLIQHLFHFGIKYKHFWNSSGFSTPLTDKILFDKTRRVFGNNLKALVVGGAALDESTHLFLRSALNSTIAQGYGTTETFALVTAQQKIAYESDCGQLHAGVQMMIQDWEEGDYRVNNQPHARGELVVGGKHVSIGYFKREEESAESFFPDPIDPEIKWFRTGDIVQVDKELGTIRIIDRKKDLVKLSNGEFVALGLLESKLSAQCPFASNLMVYGSSYYANTIVILVPDEAALCQLVNDLELDPRLCHDFAEMCLNQQIIDSVTKSIHEAATRLHLSRVERPAKVILVPDQWTAENGLTTASLKNRRKQLVDKYADQIRQAYQSLK